MQSQPSQPASCKASLPGQPATANQQEVHTLHDQIVCQQQLLHDVNTRSSRQPLRCLPWLAMTVTFIMTSRHTTLMSKFLCKQMNVKGCCVVCKVFPAACHQCCTISQSVLACLSSSNELQGGHLAVQLSGQWQQHAT